MRGTRSCSSYGKSALSWLLSVALLALVLHPDLASGSRKIRKNGFVLDDALIPVQEIRSGGPPRDGIPSIDRPQFVAGSAAVFLKDKDRILGIERNGVVKAYPIAILNYHEIVNDVFSNEPIVVTYCPLCGTGMAFRAAIGGERRVFGVSGLLYNSDVLLYDRNSETLWSQLLLKAVAGPLKGSPLEMISVSHTSWGDWLERHPQTVVLSNETGFGSDYGRDLYPGYEKSRRLMFPVSSRDRSYHPKERVIGLIFEGTAKAYPFVELDKAGGNLEDVVAGKTLRIEFDAEHRTGRVLDADGREIPTVLAYWFAWSSFYPKGEVFSAP